MHSSFFVIGTYAFILCCFSDGPTDSPSQDNKQKHDDNKENKATKNQQGKKGKAAVANDDVKFSVGQVYPIELAKSREPLISNER